MVSFQYGNALLIIMNEYNIEDINVFLEELNFDKLNEAINSIVSKSSHDFKDLEILKLVSSSDAVSVASKEQLKILYLRYKKEIEEKIFAGESKLPHTIDDSDYELKLMPSQKIATSSAYVNFKTTLLIIGLTIAVIIAIAILTLKG